MRNKPDSKGFTLIELSIVLVIIGLIVGGVLVGQDLIRAAEVRAQVTQIEKYNTAVNTFYSKYGGLPGDLNFILAGNFGFPVGTNCSGQIGGRNGDGMLQDDYAQTLSQVQGEVENFWSDLSSVGMIEGTYPNSSGLLPGCTPTGQAANSVIPPFTAQTVNNYLPPAKIGYSSSIYVYTTGGVNWFGLSSSAANGIAAGNGEGFFTSTAGIPVRMAHAIDTKLDDGLPLSGNVQAVFANESADLQYWYVVTQSPNASSDSAQTCFNTSNPSGAYSVSYNGGAMANCGLSFRFQ